MLASSSSSSIISVPFDSSMDSLLPVARGPGFSEMKANEKLTSFLTSHYNIYESTAQQNHRKVVITKIHEILVRWSENIGREKGLSDEECLHGGGITIRIFGSTRLGVNTPDADIDILCIASSYIKRTEFFTRFCQELSSQPNVSMVSSIPEAYTPVIKFNMEGIEIDMIFVSLSSKYVTVPQEMNVLDDMYLDGLDEQSVRSLNGVRVAESIEKLVPNFDTFCCTLRAVKLWARQRAIYSNILGFLGGVNYAILTAFVCRENPNATPALLLEKFFQRYSAWVWPNEITLCPIQERPTAGGQYLPVWNRMNPKDAMHIMPIITPTYPAMNSSYNVGPPQFRAVYQEFCRGQELFQRYPHIESFPWEKLFEPVGKSFFSRYPAYVQIDISAESIDDHRAWFGWVESKMRLLVLALEKPPYIFSHPLASCYHQTVPRAMASMSITGVPTMRVPTTESHAASSKQDEAGSEELTFISTFFIGLSFFNGSQPVDASSFIDDVLRRISSWPTRRPGMDLHVCGRTPATIPSFVFDSKAEPSSVKNCTPKKLIKKSSSSSRPSTLLSAPSLAEARNESRDDDFADRILQSESTAARLSVEEFSEKKESNEAPTRRGGLKGGSPYLYQSTPSHHIANNVQFGDFSPQSTQNVNIH